MTPLADTRRGRLAGNVALIAVSLVAAYALKRHYSGAAAEDLLWILAPTAWLAAGATGAQFAFEPGVGFVDHAHLFAIIPACAGINFLIVAFVSGAVGLTRIRAAPAVNAAIVVGSAVAAYAATVAVNAIRIAIAFWSHTRGVEALGLAPAELHRVQGTAIYLAALLVSYAAARTLIHGGGHARGASA